ncbi:LIM domain-binding protein 2b isoform X2 [Trichomycterus rosablanca]|uniref:LIM domain-binding protein 2b isoform X2 n=2 Tax=Trichomycterus rosablanca TaxID=2290929 RepID=UPI002F35170B
MSGAPRDPFYSSPFGPFYRRHEASGAAQPQYRVHELNKRLQNLSEDCDMRWWDSFCTEFFEEDATLTLSFCLEDGPKTYTIGRALIPRFFSTLFEGGVHELFFVLKHTKESFNSSSIAVDCQQCSMITQHGRPTYAKVCTEGRLYLVFTFDDLMRIKTWDFSVLHYDELVPRTMLAVHAQDPGALEQLSKNISRVGLTNLTLNYLRLCMILEPMQELMSRHKTYGLSPRDCLKSCLFHQWQRITTPPVGPSANFKAEVFQTNSKKPETAKPPAKRRRRRNSAGSASNGGSGNGKKRGQANSLSLPAQPKRAAGKPRGGGWLEAELRM